MSISIRMLKKVLSIQSHSNRTGNPEDTDIRNYIKSVLSSNNIYYYEDDYGNIYAIKGKAKTYPCIVSHVDTVHRIVNNFEIKKSGEFLYAFDNEKVRQTGIGGDDKVGVYITLEFILNSDIAKVVFFRNEEIGRLGSRESIKNHKDFYKNCRYIIQPDRKENEDFIYYSGGIDMCSDKFIEDSKEIYEAYRYKKVRGIATDVDTLVKNHVGISCVNLSCGYYRAHTDSEVVSIYDVDDAYNLILDLVDHLGEKQYPFKHVERTYTYNSRNNTHYDRSKIYKERSFPLTNLELDMESNVFNSKFIPLKNYNIINILQENSIINTGIKCPRCGYKNTLFFLPEENSFFCTSEKCNNFIDGENEIKKINFKFYIIDNDGEKYRHMKYTNQWMQEENCVWNESIGSFVPVSKAK